MQKLTANEKRSLSLRGRYFPHRDGKYKPSLFVVCETCGTKFKKKQSIIKKTLHNYCSHKCDPNKRKVGEHPWNYGKMANLIIRNCPNCNKEFKIKEPKNKQGLPKIIYCGARCSKKNLNGVLIYKYKTYYRYEPYYGPNWKKQKKLCLERDRGICRVCKKTNINIDVDHIIEFQKFNNYLKANKLSNLWCLCDRCHGIKTRLQIKYPNKLTPAQWEPLIAAWYPKKSP